MIKKKSFSDAWLKNVDPRGKTDFCNLLFFRGPFFFRIKDTLDACP